MTLPAADADALLSATAAAESPRTPASEARLRANSANSARSRGPINTAETKYNAYRHGLAARSGRASADMRQVELLAEALEPDYRPSNPLQRQKLLDIAAGQHRTARAREMQALAREDLMSRTRAEFDADRRADAEALAERLPKRPGSVAAKLRTTAPGCAVLIARWEGLMRIFVDQGAWDDAQRQEALDLLGVPNSQRVGNRLIPEGDPRDLVKFVRAEIAGLATLKASGMDAREDREYERQKAGYGLENQGLVKLYRRYEREAQTLARLAEAALREDQAKHPEADEAEAETEAGATVEPAPSGPVAEDAAEAVAPEVSAAAATPPEPAEAPSPAPRGPATPSDHQSSIASHPR